MKFLPLLSVLNLFATAKTTEKKTTKSDKPVRKVSSAIQKLIKSFKTAKIDFEEAKTEIESNKSELTDHLFKMYIAEYKLNGKRPDTLVFGNEKEKIQFLVQSRFGKIDQERYQELVDTFGEGVAEEVKVFSLNPLVLEKNMNAISKAIMDSKEISKADKEDLFVANVSYQIKKDVLDRLHQFKNGEDVLLAVSPVKVIKNVG